MRIPFHKPYITGKELTYITDIIQNGRDMCGDSVYTKKAHKMLVERYKTHKALLTTSCTSALEFAVRLLNLEPGDEIIAPSFTFSSTINAILMESQLKVVFAEVKPDTLNIDPDDIERKITSKTKAIIVVHYAGVAADMDRIMEIATMHHLKVIEDAAQAIESKYNGRYLGTIGDFGCLSFHDTKNITCGEGGALLINNPDPELYERAEIIREKGTNRSKFFRGLIDKYTWVDIGSSYLPSDILAAYLVAQLEQADMITKKRMDVYEFYKKSLQPLADQGMFSLPTIPTGATHNAHIFYLLFKNASHRDFMLDYLRSREIMASFHYIPLHSSPQGERLGYQKGDLPITEHISECLLRLPIYSSMSKEERNYVVETFKEGLNHINDGDKRRTVTVGIPAYNEEGNIASLLRSVIHQTSTNHTLEKIIIACDGSTDKTADIVMDLAKKDPRIELIYDATRHGKAYRMNALYQMNTSDILVTFDADVVLTNKTLDALVAQFDDESIQLVSAYDLPTKATTWQQRIINTWFLIWQSIREDYKGGDTLYNIHGNGSALRKNFARSIHYPTDITADQDYLYMWAKKNNAGYKYAKNAVIYFRNPTTLTEFYFQTTRFLTEKNRVEVIFPDIAQEAYHIPLSLKISKIIKYMKKDFVFTVLALVVYGGLISFGKSRDPLNTHGMWQSIASTKNAIMN